MQKTSQKSWKIERKPYADVWKMVKKPARPIYQLLNPTAPQFPSMQPRHKRMPEDSKKCAADKVFLLCVILRKKTNHHGRTHFHDSWCSISFSRLAWQLPFSRHWYSVNAPFFSEHSWWMKALVGYKVVSIKQNTHIYIYLLIYLYLYLYIYLPSKPWNSYQLTLKPIANSDVHANHGGDPTQKGGDWNKE